MAMFALVIVQVLEGLLIGTASLSMAVLNCRFAKKENPGATNRLHVKL